MVDEPEDEEDKEGEEGEEGKSVEAESGGPKKIIIFASVLLLIVIGAGGGLYFSGILDSILPSGKTDSAEHGTEHAGDAHGKDKHEEVVPVNAIFLPIENDVLVNLSTSDSRVPRYLRLSGMQLELHKESDRAVVKALMPRILDKFNEYLRVLRVKDLQGSAGLYRLRIELLARVNEVTYPVKVKNILFKEVLVQ